jgi:allantoinase
MACDEIATFRSNLLESRSTFVQPTMNTRKLVVQEGGFKYDSDSYADDLPYWTLDYGEEPHLIIPYSLSENDMRFTSPSNFSTGAEFCQYLKDTLK